MRNIKILVLILLLIILLFFLFPSCTRNAQEANPISISPSTTIENNAIADVTETVTELNIKTADQWNDFARSFNDGAVKYADYLTVIISGWLDFQDNIFVPLYSNFNGCIRGPEIHKDFTEIFSEDDLLYKKRFPGLGNSGCGFRNISDIENVTGESVPIYWEAYPDGKYVKTENGELSISHSLFGIKSDNLTLEGLAIDNVDSELLSSLFTYSANSLTIKNISISNTHLPNGHALLALNADKASVNGLVLDNVKIDGDTFMGGLFYWVYSDASFIDVNIYHSSFNIRPDNGGSGIYLASLGLLVGTVVNGNAEFERIVLYNCSAYGLGVNALCSVANNVIKCNDILIERCSLLCYPIGYSQNKEFLYSQFNDSPLIDTNVVILDCLLDTQQDLESFRQRGYTIENCVNISSS